MISHNRRQLDLQQTHGNVARHGLRAVRLQVFNPRSTIPSDYRAPLTSNDSTMTALVSLEFPQFRLLTSTITERGCSFANVGVVGSSPIVRSL